MSDSIDVSGFGAIAVRVNVQYSIFNTQEGYLSIPLVM